MQCRFGSDVGKKFNTDGTVRFWPGNTMVCILDHHSEVFQRVREVRDALKASAIGPFITTLPDESLHMTAIEGVVDGKRDKEHWTSKLPLVAPLSEVDDFFAAEFEKLPPMGKVLMDFDCLRTGGGFNIGLKPHSRDDEERIRTWRKLAADAMGLHFPGWETYVFHIGLAYGITLPDAEGMLVHDTWPERYQKEWHEHPFTFQVPEPSMTYFDNMFFFSKKRIPRQG